MSGKYKHMTDETTDEDVSGEDGPLSQGTEPISTRAKIRKYSGFRFGGRLNFSHNRNKIITTIFILVTLTFAISTWVLILLFGFVFAPNLKGDSENLVCNLPSDSEEIVKPLIDTRSYLYKELGNRLRVLVISDPQTELSGAALSVLSGTLNEGEVDGLAHFCEHMLFLGNENFPEPDYFFDFLGQHGGRANAYTDLGITNYFFQVESDSFVSAVDIFSSFFIKPLFDPEYVEKEINAVNSEYENDKLNEDWRLFRLLQVVSQETSPFQKFSIGNIETLNISSISTDVSDYYKRYYSSNLMTVVLFGNQNVTELMEIAVFNFSSIPNTNLDRNSYSYPYSQLPNIVIAQGLTKETYLILTFQLPSFQEYYRLGPTFLTHLLSYSGNNSYISYLKDKTLIFDVDFTVNDLVSTTLLQISLRIPNDLIYNDKWSEIVTQFFSYVYQLRDIPSEDMKVIFDSWLGAQQKHFDYEHPTYDMSYFAGLARQMQTINATHYLLDPPCALEYDFNFINTEIIGQLIPSKLLTILYSDAFNITGNQDWPNLIKSESYFNLHYNILSPNSDLIMQWNRAAPGKFSTANNLPVPTDFALLTGSNERDPKLSLSDSRDTWHLQNTQYSLPYIQLSCLLETNEFTNSTLKAATINLYSYVLNALLSGHLDYYQGFYSFSYSYDYMTGILLNYEGYSDVNLLSQFIDSTTELVTDIQSLYQNPLFDVSYTKLVDSWVSFYQSTNARSLVFYYFNLLFYTNSYRVEELLSALTADNFTSLMTSIHQNSFLNCFSFGNVDDSLTKDFLDRIQNKFGSRLTTHPTLSQVSTFCPGGNYTYWQRNPIQGDSNSVVDVVFQLGRVCNAQRLGDACDASLLKRWVLMKILSTMLSPQFFSQLRTEEQLGYVVYSLVLRNYDSAFLHFVVQSSVKDPDYLESRIDAFLLQFGNNLLNETDWVQIISSYNDSITEPNSFDSTFESVWSEISNMQFQFSRILQIRNLLSQISGQDVISFYNSTFFGENAAPRMNIKVFANIPGVEQPSNRSDVIYYETINTFKSNLVC